MKKHIFVLGARGYRRNYGGWETFVNHLLDNWKDDSCQFYVCEINQERLIEPLIRFIERKKLAIHPPLFSQSLIDCDGKNTGKVKRIPVCIPHIGNAAMVVYDAVSLFTVRSYIKQNKLENAIIYSLGSRVGILYFILRPWLKSICITILENPAGLEWERDKWGVIVKKYCKISAYAMARACDYLICDSRSIKDYYDGVIKNERPQKLFIAYGAYETALKNVLTALKVKEAFTKLKVDPQGYYLMLGRFVPENNYELIIKGFMKSKTKRKLIIICDVGNNRFYFKLRRSTGFEMDDRIQFIGPLYERELLSHIRQNAFAYIHGHSVGGTNPGLLEAMAETDVNILYDVSFNREVGQAAALYFRDEDQLSDDIEKCDRFSDEERSALGTRAKERIKTEYQWGKIVAQYETLFQSI